MVEEYLEGALGRFVQPPVLTRPTPKDADAYYRVPRPGLLWNGPDSIPLAEDGGRTRPASVKSRKAAGSSNGPGSTKGESSPVSIDARAANKAD